MQGLENKLDSALKANSFTCIKKKKNPHIPLGQWFQSVGTGSASLGVGQAHSRPTEWETLEAESCNQFEQALPVR